METLIKEIMLDLDCAREMESRGYLIMASLIRVIANKKLSQLEEMMMRK